MSRLVPPRSARLALFALVAFFASGFVVSTSTAGGPFAGVYGNEAIRLELSGDGPSYRGTVTFEGQTFPVTATSADGRTMSGSYQYSGQAIPFSAALQSNMLTIQSEGEQLMLPRIGGASGTGNGVSTGQGRTRDDAWGMSFVSPDGWTPQRTDGGYVLLGGDPDRLLLIVPHESKTVADLRAEARQGLTEEGGTDLHLTGDLKDVGTNGVAGEFEGTLAGTPAHAFAIGLISPHGTGATVLAIAATAKYDDALVERARSLAKGIEFYKSPVPPEAVSWKQKLDGCRLSYFSRYNSGGGGGGYTTQTTIDLCAEGYFKWNLEDETVWNADPGGVTGGYSMQHGKGNGTWKIVGRGGSAALLLTFHDGSTREYVLSTNDQGQTFLDGDRYLRTCDPNDGVVEARPQCP